MKINLSAKWDNLLSEHRQDVANLPEASLPLPPHIPSMVVEAILVENRYDAERALADIKSMHVKAIAADSEYWISRASRFKRSNTHWYDIRSQYPIVFSLSVLVSRTAETEGYIIQYAFDVRQKEVLPSLENIFRLRVPFIFHNIKAELFSLWSLGLEIELHQIYDTQIAAATLILGIHHHRCKPDFQASSDVEQIEMKDDSASQRSHYLSLVGQCNKYGLQHPFEKQKEQLQQEFLNFQPTTKLEERHIEYAVADSTLTLQIYLRQHADIINFGLAHHLYTLEFPFAIANARIEWTGVNTSPEQMRKLRDACVAASNYYKSELENAGMLNARSKHQFLRVIEENGLIHNFTEKTKTGEYRVNDDILLKLESHHPLIQAYRLHQKYSRLGNEEWLLGRMRGSDGRIHPQQVQLGAHTGRNTCKLPNLAGIGKVFRPIVTAPPGRAIFEHDFSQIEVVVAAGEYNDPVLTAAVNSGDVYSFMAAKFYPAELTEAQSSLSPDGYIKYKKKLRDRMKVFVLAVFYNMQAAAIATSFKISISDAEIQREKFLDMFPVVKKALAESSHYGVQRGYANTVSGLKRHIPPTSNRNQWVKNFLRNTPIQGSAADIFKSAVVAVDRDLRATNARIILIIHDAIVIECDQDDLQELAARTRAIMEQTVRAFYPKVKARVDTNLSQPHCWNKDGHSDSLDTFLSDPSFNLDHSHEYELKIE